MTEGQNTDAAPILRREVERREHYAELARSGLAERTSEVKGILDLVVDGPINVNPAARLRTAWDLMERHLEDYQRYAGEIVALRRALEVVERAERPESGRGE